GFEYGVDSDKIIVKRGDQLHRKFVIRREVPTDGWVSSDTHIHTLTYSKHGDATIEERALTIAGEGIELPITTEHNITTDLKAVAKKMNVSAYFTPVMGMEWTTSVGHFNLFPLSADEIIPNHQLKNWNVITDSLNGFLKNGIVILNHARDIHNDFRPFDPRHHIAIAGLNVDGWNIPANAMEVINSGSQQTDPMRLLYDWFGMLNRGYFLTPAGSSDSHDVGRYLVGQARTYIRCADKDAGQINIKEAVQNFKEGKVMVSFGLLTEIRINNRYGPGALVPASDKIKVSVRVLGPEWIKADGISLYANGVRIRGAEIKQVRRAGIKWQGTWVIPRPKHDIFLVAVAEGPGTLLPFWPIAKPYQPATPEWSPSVMGISGAVWIDGDKNGPRNSAYSYAKELINDSNHDINRLVEKLAAYDKAVTIQAAALLAEQGWTVTKNELINSLNKAQPATKIGFLEFISEWEKAQPKNRE
ncbi:MAG: CehA/McbA family metallohydrolase, partial [Flavisolibacter sp.]|nr:CehA/McbA family metallohydrolase [Flavisolibacter sp.]